MASNTTTAFLTITITITLLLFLINTTTATSNTTSPSTAPTTAHHRAQLNTIIDAIIGATDFSNWANLLTGGDPTTSIPLSATVFFPENNNHLPPASHVIPRRLTFSELQLFPTGAHLPGLIPGNALVITNNSALNFTINHSKLTKPDFYLNAVVSVHGVERLLFFDASLRGGGGGGSTSRRRPPRSPPTPSLRPPPAGDKERPRPPTSSVSSAAAAAAGKARCWWGLLVVVLLAFRPL